MTKTNAVSNRIELDAKLLSKLQTPMRKSYASSMFPSGTIDETSNEGMVTKLIESAASYLSNATSRATKFEQLQLRIDKFEKLLHNAQRLAGMLEVNCPFVIERGAIQNVTYLTVKSVTVESASLEDMRKVVIERLHNSNRANVAQLFVDASELAVSEMYASFVTNKDDEFLCLFQYGDDCYAQMTSNVASLIDSLTVKA